MNRRFYVLVRTDLSLRQQICQAVHAAHEAGRHLSPPTRDPPTVVVCAIPGERDLLRIRGDLETRGVRTVLFREPDLGDQATALATEPLESRAPGLLRRLPLWGGV